MLSIKNDRFKLIFYFIIDILGNILSPQYSSTPTAKVCPLFSKQAKQNNDWIKIK